MANDNIDEQVATFRGALAEENASVAYMGRDALRGLAPGAEPVLPELEAHREDGA